MAPASATVVGSRKNRVASGGGGGGSFTPFQRFTMDNYTTGSAVNVTGFSTSYNGGYGGRVVTTQHRASKSKSMEMSIKAGFTGDPNDVGGVRGLWGASIDPPSGNYGVQGDKFHIGMWMYLPTGVTMDTTTLNDGAQKFLLFRHPLVVTSGKNDIHICSETGGIATIKEYDGNAATNNSYPSDANRAGAEAVWPRDQWFWLERYDKLHSDGDQAEMRFWVNDALWFEQVGRARKFRKSNGTYNSFTAGTVGNPTLPTSGTNLEGVNLLSYWNAFPSVDTIIYFDGFTTAKDETGMTTDSFGNAMIGTANAG